MPTIHITSREGATAALRGPHPYTHILQLTDSLPPFSVVDGFSAIPHRVMLPFDDIVTAKFGRWIGPDDEDIKAIIDFGRQLGEAEHALIHCEAGISRSAASAYVIWADRLGPGNEAEALANVYAVRPYARPNTRIIKLAEAQLGRGTALSDALEAHKEREAIRLGIERAAGGTAIIVVDAAGEKK